MITIYSWFGYNIPIKERYRLIKQAGFDGVMVTLAKKGNQVVGMAGASNDCAMMWQIGMDVLPEYRSCGLAAYLVNWLTLEILNRGYVPYYGTASSNIAS